MADDGDADGPNPSAPTPLSAGLRGLCPRCGAPTLFDGMLRFAPACRACGLDFDRFNVGDGPAAFLTFALGTIVTVLAIVVELRFSPPWWVHALLFVPTTVAGVIVTTRIGKGMLLALEYRNSAREGRAVPPSAP